MHIPHGTSQEICTTQLITFTLSGSWTLAFNVSVTRREPHFLLLSWKAVLWLFVYWMVCIMLHFQFYSCDGYGIFSACISSCVLWERERGKGNIPSGPGPGPWWGVRRIGRRREQTHFAWLMPVLWPEKPPYGGIWFTFC